MPPTSKEVGFTLSRSSAATRYSASERSIRDALPPYWLLGLKTVAVSKRLLGIRPQHRPVCGYLPERERQQEQRQRYGCVDPARSRWNALGSEGWVLNLKKEVRTSIHTGNLFQPTPGRTTPGALPARRPLNPYPSDVSKRQYPRRFL